MKRFTETQKWSDSWFRRLSPAAKLLWSWLCDNCDAAGVIEPDLELASFQIGVDVTEETFLEFGDRVQLLGNKKFHIVRFIEFQYGRISPDCKAHRPVFQSLERHFPQNPTDAIPEGNGKGINTLKEKDKDKEKEKDKVQEKDTRSELAQKLPALGQSMDALKTRINGLRPEWGKPARWNRSEEEALFGGTAGQLEELTDDDWELVKSYLNAHVPKSADFWQPVNRLKFVETFPSVWGSATRWQSKPGNGPAPKTRDTRW